MQMNFIDAYRYANSVKKRGLQSRKIRKVSGYKAFCILIDLKLFGYVTSHTKKMNSPCNPDSYKKQSSIPLLIKSLLDYERTL